MTAAEPTPEPPSEIIEEEVVDLFTTVDSENASPRLKRLAERERDLARQLLGLAQTRSSVVAEQTRTNPAINELYTKMTEARLSYENALTMLDEIENIDNRSRILRKQLQEVRDLAQKTEK